MTTAQSQEKPAPVVDKILVARLTGQLGDRGSVGKLCSDISLALCEYLPAVLRKDTGVNVEVTYAGFDVGYKTDLVEDLGDTMVLSNGSLPVWCTDFTIACGSQTIITLVESMLGAMPDAIEEPEPRPLSRIELDLAEMVIGRIGNVLRSAVTVVGTPDPVLEKPYNAENAPKTDLSLEPVHAASINMNIVIGKVKSTFSIVIPQFQLLKTKVNLPKSKAHAARENADWTEQLKEQVSRSQVTLEARIKLQSLTLATVSRLQAGDVIPFFDLKDVRVGVNASGKELYVGEFGKSGSKYTVRVQDTFGSEDELLQHLMS
jgi:flagellar motor switch protein FliM